MGLTDTAVPGDTLNIVFEVDHTDQQCCHVTSVCSRHITVLHHEPWTRLCFIDMLTGDVISAWHVNINSDAEDIIYDYYSGDFEGMLSLADARIIFVEGTDGLRYIKNAACLTATVGEALACR